MNSVKRLILGTVAVALLAVVYLAGQSPRLTRGPYLQMGTTDGVLVRWRTSVATESRVCYGRSASPSSSCLFITSVGAVAEIGAW